MIRIICTGNRYHGRDSAGPQVYDLLAGAMPDGVGVIDGGLAGLNLLGAVDGVDRVVFVDSVSGYAKDGEVVILRPGDLPEPGEFCGHASGLPYLVAALPHACNRAPREIFIVGLEGEPAGAAVEEAALAAREIACTGNYPGPGPDRKSE